MLRIVPISTAISRSRFLQLGLFIGLTRFFVDSDHSLKISQSDVWWYRIMEKLDLRAKNIPHGGISRREKFGGFGGQTGLAIGRIGDGQAPPAWFLTVRQGVDDDGLAGASGF